MAGAGNRAAVLETTSHGLATDRVRAVAYDAAILTNLSHEHLEFHGSWEAYRDAKLSLFERLATTPAYAAKGDPAPRGRGPRSSTPTTRRPAHSSASPRRPAPRSSRTAPTSTPTSGSPGSRRTAGGCASRYESRAGAATLQIRLAGRFNAYNALAVVALGEGLGLDAAAIRAGLDAQRHAAVQGWHA